MKNKHWLGTTALCAVTMTGLLASSNAHAADAAPPAPSDGLQEIVVTARGRSEIETQVPISMQSFSADALAAANITDVQTLSTSAGFTFQQGVSTQGGGREFPALVMRGLQSTYGGGVGDSGAVFVDGIYISAGAAGVNTADVSQVEVLKGPQNVYFGKNTFGGAVNFITTNPGNTFGGSVDASGSELGSSTVTAMVEGPLIPDLLAARLTVQNYDKAAQYHTSDGGDLGAENTRSVTGSLFFTPTDSWWVRFRGHYQEDNDSAADTGFLPGETLGSNCPKVTSGPYFCGTIPSLGKVGTGVLDQNTAIPAPFAQALATNSFQFGGSDQVLAKVPSLDHSGLRRDLTEVSLQSGVDLPYNSNLQINLGYNSDKSLDIWDLDRSTNGGFLNAQPISSSDVMADIRLVSDQNLPVRGLIGANYFQSFYEISQDDDDYYSFPQGFPNYVITQPSNYVNEIDKTSAVYASLDVDITSWLTATGEVRYQREILSDFAAGDIAKASESFGSTLPRFIVKYHPEKDWDFYASYAKGVQPAQLQTSYFNGTPAQQAYLRTIVPGANDFSPQPTLDSYEIGAKQNLFDNRLSYSLALYDERWDHQQTFNSIFNPAACGVTISLTAACPLPYYGSTVILSNRADIKGIEFSTTAKPIKQLTVDLTLNYLDPIWKEYQNNTLASFTGGVNTFNGNTIARQPNLTGVLSATYRDRLVGDWDWYARGQVSYQGPEWESEINSAQTAAFARINATLGFAKDNLSIELYCTNCLGDQNWDWASRVPDLGTLAALNTGYSKYLGLLVQAPDRRDGGVKLHYKF